MREAGPGQKQRSFLIQNDGSKGATAPLDCPNNTIIPRGRMISRPLRNVLAYRVVDHVDAFAAGEAFDFCHKILASVDDHFIGAGGFGDGGLASVPAVP